MPTPASSGSRRLIVNADDFGLSEGVNRGIRIAHERGIVTSASLMVKARAARGAAEYARRNRTLGLGLHVDLGEWLFENGDWGPVYQVVPLGDAAAVRAEVDEQLELFRTLTGGNPTHLDTHQHVHREEPVLPVMLAVADELGVPLRGQTPGIAHEGGFHGQTGTGRPYPQGITVERLLELLRDLRPGFTELSCHPGLDRELASPYRAERAQEVLTLCDPRVQAVLTEERVELTLFAAVMLKRGHGVEKTNETTLHGVIG